ncbi:MAG: hypothetical protein RLZZ488_392 [Pseudomonadota bacterium]|jgi:mono/diheme cytochrome c family protein
MGLSLFLSAFVLAALSACGQVPTTGDAAQKKLESKQVPTVSSKKDSGHVDGASGNAPSGSPPAAENPPPGSANGGGNPGSGNSANAMTLDEAKARCVACHQPGASGARVWDKAGGNEADWAAFANASRSAVVSDRMPPPPQTLSATDKARMIAFLDKLLAGSAAQPAPPAQAAKFTFETARLLCIGCHSAGGESPRLETVSQWRRKKGDIRKEVRSGSMPRRKTLSAEERKDLLEYINSL